MISKQNIIDYINSNYCECLEDIHMFEEEIIEGLTNIFDTVNLNKNSNQVKSEQYFIRSIIKEYIEDLKTYSIRKNKFNNLLKLELPEQRSPEWFEMRRDKLTASSFATALGDDHYRSKFKLIHDKLTDAPHISNIHTEWGTK